MEPVLVPYVKSQGVWSIPDESMVLIYYNMVHHKLDKVMFKNGEVNNADEWMKLCQSRNHLFHIIRSSRDYPADFIAWLNNWSHNSAFGHFCCFPHVWGTGESYSLGKMTVDYWFNTMKKDDWSLDAIFGKIPSSNKRAIEYIENIGFRKLGEVSSIRYKDDKISKGATFFVKERQ